MIQLVVTFVNSQVNHIFLLKKVEFSITSHTLTTTSIKYHLKGTTRSGLKNTKPDKSHYYPQTEGKLLKDCINLTKNKKNSKELQASFASGKVGFHNSTAGIEKGKKHLHPWESFKGKSTADLGGHWELSGGFGLAWIGLRCCGVTLSRPFIL